MKNFTKTALTLLAASVITTSAFASEQFGSTGEAVYNAQNKVDSIALQLESMGANVNKNVDFNGVTSPYQKVDLLNAKQAQLQQQFDALHAQAAE